MRLVSLVFAAGCGPVQDPPDKGWVQIPEKALDFFTGCLRARKYDFAHLALSTATQKQVPMEALIMAMDSYPTLRRLVAASETRRVEVQGSRGRVTVWNRFLGLQWQVTLKKEHGDLWAIDVSPDELEKLSRAIKAWLDAQFEDTLGRTLFPPDARTVPGRRID